MIIRNGIRSNLRARGRTALFSGMILVLTLVMILALGVRLYSGSALAECDRVYRSIAMLEYMGVEYPSTDEPDPDARAASNAIDDDALSAVNGVTAWYRSCHTLSLVDGFRRQGNDMPYKDRGVIVVTHLSPMYEVNVRGDKTLVYYTAIITDSLYSYSGKSQVFVSVLPDYIPQDPEYGDSYVLHGRFVDGDAMGVLNGITAFLVQPFPDSDSSPVVRLEPGEMPGELFRQYADHYRTINNYVHTVACGDLNDQWEFHQSIMYLRDGTMPEGEDQCVISGDLADSMGVSVGDTLRVTAFASADNDRYNITLTDQVEELTVSGVTNVNADYAGYLWRQMEPTDQTLFGYHIGTVQLDNRKAGAAIEALEKMMPENVRVTLLDQGYGDAVEPFLSMQSTATNVLLLCAVGTAAVLVLFALLFVGRQSETVRILVSLGTPRKKIVLWLLSGALVISGGASLLGGILGMLGLPAMFRIVQQKASTGIERIRFSETLISAVKESNIAVHTPVWPMLLTILAIILLSLVLNYLFINVAYHGGTLRRGKSRVRVPHGKTTTFGTGSLRYALLSVRRGGPRAIVVTAVSTALAVIIIVLGGVYRGWENQLDEALYNTKLEGQVTSSDGRFFSGLNVPIATIRDLLSLDDVGEIYVSYRQIYWMDQDIPAFGEGTFAQERRSDWIDAQSELVMVNDLKGAKEFYFTEPDIQWIDGWDSSCLADTGYPTIFGAILGLEKTEDPRPYPAVVGDTFMESHSLKPGDVFYCNTRDTIGEFQVALQIVGVYHQSGERAHVYLPLAAAISPDLVFTNEKPDGDSYFFRTHQFYNVENYYAFLYEETIFTSCRFTLNYASHLEETRNTLFKAGFGWPGYLGSNRITLVLRDASFIKMTENLSRYLAMGKVMLGLIFGVVALLGFIISWLMISGRKREFAVMRGFGVKKGRLFLSFFWEQALLCLLGCAIGCFAMIWLYAGGSLQWLVLGGYVICYLAGCAISVKLIGKMNLMELLSNRE